MSSSPAAGSSRRTVIVGFGALVGVLLVLLVQATRPAPPRPEKPGPALAFAPVTEAVVAAPASASPSEAAPSEGLEDLPRADLPEDGLGATVEVEAVAGAIAEHKGRLLRCQNTVDALPGSWRPPRPGSAPSLPGAGYAEHRLTLLCSGAAGGARVQVYFEPTTVSALPAIGRHTEVLLQVLGQDPAGQIAARFVRVLARPRLPTLASQALPDLLGALVDPNAPAERAVVCVSAGPAQVLADADLTQAARGLLAIGDSEDRPGALVALACRDRREVEVPVWVQFDAGDAPRALQVTRATALRVLLRGRSGGRLLARFQGIAHGAIAAAGDDLRRVLLAPQAHLGRTVRCRSMGVPAPQALEEREPAPVQRARAGLDDRKAWLVCAHPVAPAVHVGLFFAAGARQQLLSVGRGTALDLKVLGVAQGRILAVLERVVDGAIPAAGQTGDLRRFGLLTDQLLGRPLPCALLASSALLPAPAQAGGRRSVWVRCRDGIRAAGQQVEVLLPDGAAGGQGAPYPAGVALDLRLSGFANNLPVARLLKWPRPAPPDDPAAPAPSALPGTRSAPVPEGPRE